MTYGIIGKGTGRHQEKRLSILQQPNLKFSANFTNSIIRKRVEAFQLKYNAAAMNLRRNESMVWQSKTLGLRMLVLRLQFHSHFFASSCFGQGCVSAQASCVLCPCHSPATCQLTTAPVHPSVTDTGAGTSALGTAGTWGCQLLWCACVNNYLLTIPKQHSKETHKQPHKHRGNKKKKLLLKCILLLKQRSANQTR